MTEDFDPQFRRAGVCGVRHEQSACMEDVGHGPEVDHFDDMTGVSWPVAPVKGNHPELIQTTVETPEPATDGGTDVGELDELAVCGECGGNGCAMCNDIGQWVAPLAPEEPPQPGVWPVGKEPPPGWNWEPFGTHIDTPGPLEFGPVDEGGTPVWERMHVRESTDAGPDFCRTCSEDAGDWVPWPCGVASNLGYGATWEEPLEASSTELEEPESASPEVQTPIEAEIIARPIPVAQFEGEFARVMVGKLPALTLDMPEGYARGTHLKIELEVRVRRVSYDEVRSGERKGELMREHVFVLEAAQLISAHHPDELDPGVGGSAAQLES